MRRSSLTSIAAIPVFLVACATGSAPLSEEDVAAIGQVREAYRQAVLATDPAAIAATYTADGVEMPPHMAFVEGHQAIQARNEALARVSDFQITSVETVGYGDLAFDRGRFTFTGMVEGAPAAVADTGKYLVIARRQGDGTWLLSRAIWNSDLPLPTPAGGGTP
jgi:ketosteroid isomerase-like protein